MMLRATSRCTILLFLPLLLLESVTSQRAVVSLGKRIQNRFGRSPSNENGVLDQASRTKVTTHPEDEDDVVIKDDHVEAMAGLENIDLAFEKLKLTLANKKSGSKDILDGSIRGRAKPGRMLAILGPSGAGKSTVLHALAGRIKDNSKLKLYGNRFMNGKQLTGDSMVPAAMIEQEVTFFPHMTVSETLAFRVELKMGSLLSKTAQDNMVEDLLAQLNLKRAADTIVGDNKVRGISGGERKRLSIAVEMISAPAAILLDEPTSGLDASSASSLIQTLRELADSGKTVIAVIHQPNQHVFAKFDDVLLVSEGKQMYFGPRQDVRAYMESHGCRAPPEMGTAEHILDCISRAPLEGESEEEADARMERLAKIAEEAEVDLGITPKSSKGVQRFSPRRGVGPRANLLIQFRLLLKRAFREVLRGKTALIVKMVQQVSTALIYGGIYSLGTNQASIQDRFGLLSLIAIGSTNMAVAQTIRTFPREKAIVSKELASHMYRTLPYFLGKAISELPLIAFFNSVFGLTVYELTGLSKAPGNQRKFLGLLSLHGFLSQAAGLFIGAISPNSDVALAIFPAIIVLNIIFDGKNISEENTPKLLRWIPKLGLIRWGFEGLCVNEFEGLEFDTKGPRRGPVARTGAEALARFGLGSRTLGDVVRAQASIAGSCWVLSFLGLTLTRQRYLTMKTPNGDKQ